MTCLSHTDKLVARFELSQIFFYCRFQKRRDIFNEQETLNRKKTGWQQFAGRHEPAAKNYQRFTPR